MTTDWKALCAQLAENVRYLLDCVADGDSDPVAIAECVQHLGDTRTLLSQPESEGLTDEELLAIAAASIDPYQDSGIAIGEYEPETECAVEVYGSELIAFARAVLARWGK